MPLPSSLPFALGDILATAIPHTAQVGGHPNILMAPGSGLLIKPALPAEKLFYETAATLRDSELHTFLPRYYGSMEQSAPADPADPAAPSPTAEQYIVIEDICDGFTRPCVMDIKIGQRVWADDASPEKIARMMKKSESSTSAEMGIRIVGMRVWDASAQDYTIYGREYGYALKKDDLPSAIRSFFRAAAASPSPRYRDILDAIIDELAHLEEVLAIAPLRMYGASLLIVYEGDPTAHRPLSRRNSISDPIPEQESDSEEEEEDRRDRLVDLRIIDFGRSHIRPDIGPDEGSLLGIRSIRALVEASLHSNHLSPQA